MLSWHQPGAVYSSAGRLFHLQQLEVPWQLDASVPLVVFDGMVCSEAYVVLLCCAVLLHVVTHQC